MYYCYFENVILLLHLVRDVSGDFAQREQPQNVVEHVQHVRGRLRGNDGGGGGGGVPVTFRCRPERAMDFKDGRDGRGRDFRQYFRAGDRRFAPRGLVQFIPLHSDRQQFCNEIR